MLTLTETLPAPGPRIASGSMLIVGNPEDTHVGGHFARAAEHLIGSSRVCDVREAHRAPRPVRTFNWRLRGRRPTHLTRFSKQVLEACANERPTWLLATGIAAIDRETLAAIGRLGIIRINFLTDDPWSPSNLAPWFVSGLGEYDHVFTPRTATMSELRAAGCRRVHHLAFAYAPEIHFPEFPETDADRARFSSDVAFVGGADRERVPWMQELAAGNVRLALYGAYWDRDAVTARFARGLADAGTTRKAIGGAAVSLCLVRRSNRDGHCMRSFEVPAMAGCMVVEDTEEHRAMFGPEGEAVVYAASPRDALLKTRYLLEDPLECRRLRDAAHRRIVTGRHTYADRLQTILTTVTADA
jgi:hypothetical protein